MSNRFFILLSGSFFLAFSCGSPGKPDVNALIARDTSITAVNAYTRLVLDSSELAGFLDKETGNGRSDTSIKNFYSARNYQYAWFNEEGLTEQAEAFWSLYEKRLAFTHDSAGYNKPLNLIMDTLLNEDNVILSSEKIRNTELELTHHFFQYIRSSFETNINPQELHWYIPVRKLDPVAMLDSFLARKPGNRRPLGPYFNRLQDKLFQYAAIARQGGWGPITLKGKKLQIGDTGLAVVQLKKRLAISGNYKGDTGNLFTAALQKAVLNIQPAWGFAATGIVEPALIADLNIPVEERISQMMINAERMRWMPENNDTRIIVNIPEYTLHLFEKDTEALNMKIVVGKAANNTVIFSDEVKHIVFSPYWNVPAGIVRNEILPAMKKNSNYLRRNNMEITGYSGSLPIIRQKPGPQNALGRVKFIFPNRYNIYLHDTPSKSLFQKRNRAFSHGCIRVQHPFMLAKYLLRNDSSWTDKKIKAAMLSGRETWVPLKTPVPVFIVYLTCWVSKDGILNFRDDIYGHDKKMEQHLFK